MDKLTPEQLMQPRYEVIALFWNCPFKTGDIIEMIFEPKNPTFGKSKEHYYTIINGVQYSEDRFSEYPHLFRRLHWREHRTPEEMPGWVKGVSGFFKDKVVKIADPSQNGRQWHIENEIEHIFFMRYASDFLPATEEQYNEYLKSKHDNRIK